MYTHTHRSSQAYLISIFSLNFLKSLLQLASFYPNPPPFTHQRRKEQRVLEKKTHTHMHAMSHVAEEVNSDSVANGQLSAEVDTQEPSASRAWGLGGWDGGWQKVRCKTRRKAKFSLRVWGESRRWRTWLREENMVCRGRWGEDYKKERRRARKRCNGWKRGEGGTRASEIYSPVLESNKWERVWEIRQTTEMVFSADPLMNIKRAEGAGGMEMSLTKARWRKDNFRMDE